MHSRSRFSFRTVFVCLFAVFVCPLSLFAQSNAADGALEGFVKDATAASVPMATLVSTNLRTGLVTSTTTDTEGHYRFPLLQVGEYELLVTAQGFSEYRQTGIRLSAGQVARLDMNLAVGGAAEVVNVTGDASMVASSQAAVGEVLPEEAVRSLPITSRNVYNFHLIGPGVKGRPSTGFGTTQFIVGGADRMQWYMDGIDNTSRNGSRQIRLVITTPENVEQMQLMTGAYSAEFGRAAGGVINVITRSGTNQLSGSMMAMTRPNALIARSPLAATKTNQWWHMVQGNIGGPIVRDRLFVFANYEFNPYENVNPVTITPAAIAALRLPESELDDTNGETFHTPSVKVNYRLNGANNGFVRYNRFTNHQPGGGSGLSTLSRGNIFKDRMNGVGGQLTTVLRPPLLNELRAGYNVRNQHNTPPCAAGPEGSQINVSGVANFGCNPAAASASREASLEFIDNVTATRGAHNLKTGLNYQTTVNEPTSGLARVFTFGGLAAANGRPAVSSLDQYLHTVNGDIDPATGRPYSYTQLAQDLGNPSVSLRFNFFNAFVQDEWRVASNLTLNAGVRYELIVFPTLDPNAPYPLSRSIDTDPNNIAPRVGIAWLPGDSQKTQVRGGYGIYYDSPGLNLATNAAQRSTRLLSYQVQGTDPRAPVFPHLLSAADPTFSIVPSITAFQENFQITYAHNAGVQVSQELTRNLSVTAGYSYWGHRNAPYTHDINLSAPVSQLEDGRPVYAGSAGRPDPRFRAINLVSSGAHGSYHGIDLSVRRRFDHGLQFTFNYGYSRARNNGDLTGGIIMDPSSLHRDWGPSNLDQPHTVSTQWLYAPKFSSALRFLNGFQFSGTTFYGSGFPFSPGAGADLNNDLVLNDRLPGTDRNSAQLPSFVQTDLRVSRRIGIGGGKAVDLMIESENLFNHLNATSVVTPQRAADFGRITATRPGRYIQFGGRFTF
jgi:Carboxypeptidase regulatory-like domain/TonB dependent receptor/TonB-dependent Receptor Plug Domain